MCADRRGRTQLTGWLLAAACALPAPVALAAPPDTSQWKCERCPFPGGSESELGLGSTYVSDHSATTGDATGYDDQGGYVNADARGSLNAGAQRVVWHAEDLALDSRVVGVEGSHGGITDYAIEYRELPRHRFDSTRSIFLRTGDLLALPAGWTRATTTAGFADLAASLAPQDIESERRTLAIGAGYRPASRWQFFGDYRRDERDGNRMQGAAYFTNAVLLPRRVDQQTDSVAAGIHYGGRSGTLELGYRGSFFRNGLDAIRWQSPFITAPGAEQGALAEAPGNDFHQLVLAGIYRVPVFDSRVAFSAALGRGTQDDPLLPYTTNPALAPAPLPAATADAKVEATSLALTLVSRPLARARFRAAVHYDERDNDTPRRPWTRVIADSFLSGETQFNVPYSFDRLRTSVSGEYELTDTLRVAAGYDYLEFDREFQEVAEQTEDTGWGRLQWRLSPRLELSARGGIARREAQFYDTAFATSLEQNSLLRKFNLAYRYRQFGELMLRGSPARWPITWSAQASYIDDRYSNTAIGLTDSEQWRVAADMNWAISERASVYLDGGWDKTDRQQAGSEAFAGPDWLAAQSDHFLSIGAGLRVTMFAGKADLQLDYQRGRGSTEFGVTDVAGTGALPDLESRLDSLRLRMDFHASERLDATLQLRYERLPTEDWALEGVAPDTLPDVLTLGAEPYDDKVWMAGIGFRYRLGVP